MPTAKVQYYAGASVNLQPRTTAGTVNCAAALTGSLKNRGLLLGSFHFHPIITSGHRCIPISLLSLPPFLRLSLLVFGNRSSTITRCLKPTSAHAEVTGYHSACFTFACSTLTASMNRAPAYDSMYHS